jgi:predicted N-acetyltransferase YhbS
MTERTLATTTIRLETLTDYGETENMVREAFWDVYRPGCDEHLIIHKLRESPSFVKGLDLVACDGHKIVGVIMCPEATVVNEQDQVFTVLGLILGVLPAYQHKGIGSRLMKRAIDDARSLGYKGIVLFGSPEYYPRFGFRNAAHFGIRTSDDQNMPVFMALELVEGGLQGIQGRFHEDPAIHVKEEELVAFDSGFPHKEKHVTETQLRL